MIRPISVASDGYLSITKRVLVIAVAGYLNFGGTPPTPTPTLESPRTYSEILGPKSSRRFTPDYETEDEEAILGVIQAFLICH